VDTVYGVRPESPKLEEAIADAQDRTGVECIKMGTPHFDLSGTPSAMDKNARTLDGFAKIGCAVCLPHQATTDALLDRRIRRIRDMDKYAAMIRERGMIPGLSTHMPESIIYADETNLDVGTYIQIYNAGRVSHAGGSGLDPSRHPQGEEAGDRHQAARGGATPASRGTRVQLGTLRDQDMICLGCLTPDEAREDIEISLAQLQRRASQVVLQGTRSKASLQPA